MTKGQFYGREGADVAPASPEYAAVRNPRRLYDLLGNIWCAETCAPRMRKDWSPDNPTLGQCSITAFLAQDIFGGKVYGVPLEDGNFHCFNRVGACVFDLTSEQFGDTELNYADCPEQFREIHFAKEEKKQRYEYLKARLDQALDTERQVMAAMQERFAQDKERKLENYRQQNAFIRKGETLFTGSSLMEGFPVTEYCAGEGLPVAYNRGIGGYTTDEFLAAIDTVLLDPAPRKIFLNIGTNDIAFRQDGEDWFDHLSRNERKICEIIRDRLPGAEVFLMAYYPVNWDAPGAKSWGGLGARTNENVIRANRMVEALAGEFGFRYIDVNDGLKDENGNLRIEHTRDGIHFDSAGYRTVFERLRPYLG